jgi:hypothetical protein
MPLNLPQKHRRRSPAPSGYRVARGGCHFERVQNSDVVTNNAVNCRESNTVVRRVANTRNGRGNHKELTREEGTNNSSSSEETTCSNKDFSWNR